MIRRFILVLFLIITLSGCVIDGTIYDTSNEPSPNVTVTLLKAGTVQSTLTTGTGGYYTFSQLDDGDYTVCVSKDGLIYEPSCQDVSIIDGVEVRGVDFHAQVPETKFIKALGGDGYDEGKAIIKTDTGYLNFGTTASSEYVQPGQYMPVVIETDYEGTVISTSVINTSAVVRLLSAVKDGSGFLVCGLSYDGSYTAWIAQLDAEYNVMSEQFLAGYEEADAIFRADDNGIIVVGGLFDTNVSQIGPSAWAMKINDGNQAWVNVLGFNEVKNFRSAALANNGDIIAVGDTDRKGYVARLTQDGEIVWENIYPGTGPAQFFKTVTTSNENIAVGGSLSNSDIFASLAVIDQDGIQLFAKTFNINVMNWTRRVTATTDGGYAIVGESTFLSPTSDAFIIKTDANGNELWRAIYPGTGFDYLYDVVEGPDGGLAAIGTTDSITPPEQQNMLFIKTNVNGSM